MNDMAATILWALFAFQIKHFLCDFALQTKWQIANKGVYGHPGGLAHAGLHVVASIPALLILTGRMDVIAGVVVAEFAIHYHCDWLKANVDHRLRLTTQDYWHWYIFGFDQLIHHLTYVGIVFVMLRESWIRV